MDRDRAAQAVIRAALLLGEFLQIGVVAEGVETPLQRTLLRHLGCQRVQGYLIDQPRPASDITEEGIRRGYGEGTASNPALLG